MLWVNIKKFLCVKILQLLQKRGRQTGEKKTSKTVEADTIISESNNENDRAILLHDNQGYCSRDTTCLKWLNNLSCKLTIFLNNLLNRTEL